MLLQRLATGETGVKQARYRRRPTRGSDTLVRAGAVYTQRVYCSYSRSLALAVNVRQCVVSNAVSVYEFRRGFCTLWVTHKQLNLTHTNVLCTTWIYWNVAILLCWLLYTYVHVHYPLCESKYLYMYIHVYYNCERAQRASWPSRVKGPNFLYNIYIWRSLRHCHTVLFYVILVRVILQCT